MQSLVTAPPAVNGGQFSQSRFTPPPAALVAAFADAISRRSGRRVVRLDPFINRLAEACGDEAEFHAARADLLRRVGLPIPAEGRRAC